MSFVTCYDVVSMVLDDVTERFSGAWEPDKKAIRVLEKDCEEMDAVVRDFNCDSVEAEVDESTMDLIVTMSCEDMTLEYGRSHPFFQATRHTSSFGFRHGGRNNLEIFFRFSGIFRHNVRKSEA